ADGHADHRGTGAHGERPQPAGLHGGAPPFGGHLHHGGQPAAASGPAARARAARRRGLGRLVLLLLLVLGHHSCSLSSAGTFRCLGSTRPSGSAAANAESWAPWTTRSRSRA